MLKCEFALNKGISNRPRKNQCFFIVYLYAHIDCDDGTSNCTGHCLNKFPCNKQTGNCERGCNPGYSNSNCSKGTHLRSHK